MTKAGRRGPASRGLEPRPDSGRSAASAFRRRARTLLPPVGPHAATTGSPPATPPPRQRPRQPTQPTIVGHSYTQHLGHLRHSVHLVHLESFIRLLQAGVLDVTLLFYQ